MSDTPPEETLPQDMVDMLRRQNETLQAEVESLRGSARQSTMMADLRVAAMKAGMIDLDGIKLLDLSAMRVTETGEVPDAPAVMSSLKQSKPWLFASLSTSSPKEAPPSQPMQQKQAMEMTDDEYLAARALILRRRS